MGFNAFGGEKYKPAKGADTEQAPDPVVSQLENVAEVLEARNAQIDAPPGDLNPEQEKDLNRTIHEVIEKK